MKLTIGVIVMLGILALFVFTGCVSSSRPDSSTYIGSKLKIAYFHGCVESYAWAYSNEEPKYQASNIVALENVKDFCKKLTEKPMKEN